MSRKYSLIDLFAGCGGLTRGFVESDRFTPTGAVELDVDAAATYRANFGDIVHQGDIAAWLAAGDPPKAEVVVGGPPCQGFSNLGRRAVDDPRNLLWHHYVETIRRVRPAVFLMENVPGFLESSEYRSFENETKPRGHLRDYEIHPRILDASHFGTAQKRRRGFVIGHLRALPAPGFPKASTHDRPPTVRQILKGVPRRVTSIQLPTKEGPYRSDELHLTRNFEPISLRRFRAIPEGGNRFDIPYEDQAPCWRKHTSGSGDVMGRLRWDQPSVTIRTEFWKPEKGRYLHPSQDRPITHFEAALIQGFPPHFRWCGSKYSIGRQIGNAVPVPLGRSFALHLAAYLDANREALLESDQNAGHEDVA